MIVIPAIDVMEGRVVRLTRGDYAQVTRYPLSAEDYALMWQDGGAKRLHVVDLEGAKLGKIQNWKTLEKIRSKIDIPMEFGGGIRDEGAIESLINLGINYVILGTKALDFSFLDRMLSRFHQHIIVGLDTKSGIVQTQGWLESADLTIAKAIKELEKTKLEQIIVTDILKDGTLEGVGSHQARQILDETKLQVILSGGVSSIKDIEQLVNLGSKNLLGVIVGKALYSQALSIKDACRLTA
jgi:phosphoribosylformimino-5-aminoimidazole carboxamide ribotide isomerase